MVLLILIKNKINLMIDKKTFLLSCLLSAIVFYPVMAQIDLQQQTIIYHGDNAAMKGIIVFDKNSKGRRPAVLVVPEWWGLTDYAVSRAKQLAGLGYIAMAVDVYGDGLVADNPDSAAKFAMIFYMDPLKAKSRLDAAIAVLKTYPQTDTNNIAGIGYCFGGSILLNAARLGEHLKGVVSFHGSPIGSFHGNPAAGVPLNKQLLRAAVLVCHGAADQYVPQKDVDLFTRQMDSAGAPYTLRIYPGASHAFTNPRSTDLGIKFNMPIAYNRAADSSSWSDMKIFFASLFRSPRVIPD